MNSMIMQNCILSIEELRDICTIGAKLLALYSQSSLDWVLGALIGLIIGHGFDKASIQRKFAGRMNKRDRQIIFFASTFQILGHLTKSKGRVTETDIQLATNLMDRMQLHGETRKAAQQAFREGKSLTFHYVMY